jgi:broad specificity phosphatase PhoE
MGLIDSFPRGVAGRNSTLMVALLAALICAACAPATSSVPPASAAATSSSAASTIAIASATPVGTASPISTAVPVAALRKGGLYIVLRHGVSDVGTESPLIDLENCATQANLNEQAKRDLAVMGTDLAALAIPVGTVLASPYCRTMDSARIVFPEKQITPSDVLLRPAYMPVAGRPVPTSSDQRLVALKQMLTTVPAGATNIALVTHGEVIRGATNVDVAMGETVIVQPDGKGAFSVLARLLPLGWKAL